MERGVGVDWLAARPPIPQPPSNPLFGEAKKGVNILTVISTLKHCYYFL